jgi:hypothetical protein
MKKSISICLLLLIIAASTAKGQSDSIERHAYYAKLTANEVSQEEFTKKWREWNQKMKDIKCYPDLPLDQNNMVHYTFLNEYGNTAKTILFNRTMEWLAINYAIVPSGVYASSDDGKIIYRNSLPIKGAMKCNYTSIITIADGRIYSEFISITYEYSKYNEDGSISDINLPISDVFPIILKKPSLWDSNLDLLKLTNSLFKREAENNELYITSYNSTYDFLKKPGR